MGPSLGRGSNKQKKCAKARLGKINQTKKNNNNNNKKNPKKQCCLAETGWQSQAVTLTLSNKKAIKL